MSRDPNDLHPELRRRVHLICRDYHADWGVDPRLEVCCTFRDEAEQEKAFEDGKSRAHWGQSLHNYSPSLAVDFFFLGSDGEAKWDVEYFQRLGKYAARYGLAWGGMWRMRDWGHMEPRGYTWQQARAGVEPKWPALPGDE